MKKKYIFDFFIAVFCAFALFAYGIFGFAGDFVGAKSSVLAYGENAGDVTAGGERSADNDGGAANFTNLIVFVRFCDEDEFIDTSYDGVAVRQLIENTYTVGRYSVANYYYAASDGNVRMQNLYLFSGGGSLQLSKSRGYYAEKTEQNLGGYESGEEALRRLELREDWSAALNSAIGGGAKPSSADGNTAYPLSELDKNNDGKIDAITIIYKNATQDITVSWASPLWNYQDYSDYVSFTAEGKTITSNAYVQLTFTYESAGKPSVYTDEDGVKFLSQSVAAHETGHVFGLKDLYRSASESGIYFMSLMAKHLSPVGQFLSVKERESMGWIGQERVKRLTEEGSYTIEVSSSSVSGGTIGYKADLPKYNKTLYLEYRNFKGTQNKFDSQETKILASDGSLLKRTTLKSGLVCYLASSDMKVPSNLGTTGNNWNYEALGGTYSTKSDCALAAGEGLDIKYSDLYVEVTAIDGDRLTFSIYGEELRNTAHIHDMRHFSANAPSCTAEGNPEYYYCAECGKYFKDPDGQNEITLAETVLPKTNHKIRILPVRQPTCNEDGLTEGAQCEICGTVLKAQQTIEKLGHESGEWIVDRAPSAEETGLRHKECTRCNEVIEEEILEKLPSGDNGEDKGENGKDDGTDDGKNDDGGKNDGGSGGNNGGAGNDGKEPQPTPDNDKSESESGKSDVLPLLAILLPISALIVCPLIIAAVKSIRKKR